MLVFVYAGCPVSALGLELMIGHVLPGSEVVLFDTLPATTTLIGTKPNMVLAKTTGFDGGLWRQVNFNLLFVSSRIIWVKTPLDSDNNPYFKPDAILDLHAGIEQYQQVLSASTHAAFENLPAQAHQMHELLQLHGTLNKRLAEVFNYLTQGKSYKEIAELMAKSPRTIEKDGLYLKELFKLKSKADFAELLSKSDTKAT